MPDIHAIRTLHRRGFSKRRIAKMLGVSRATVDKYAADTFVVEAHPAMRLREPRPAPKMDPWKPVIDQWLAEDEHVPRKQRRTARKMYKDLVSICGADVSEPTVRRHVARRKKDRARKAFVPLDFPPGEMAEADFGHALVVVGDKDVVVPFFAMRLMASGASFVKAYTRETMEALLDGASSGLGFFGGVPQKLMFDNTGIIVKEILQGGRRVQTPEFQALAAHYAFEAVFANPGAGNEKGGVENLVQFAQRNFFSPVPQAESIAELNAWLREQCLADSRARHRPEGGPLVADLWEEEQTCLAPLPPVPFAACRTRFARADKLLLVKYDRAVYSVPADHAGKPLTLKAFWDRIEIEDCGRRVAVHERKAPGGSSLQIEHYLPVLAHKPRAVSHAAAIARGNPAIARYRDAFLAARPEAHRELVSILRLCEAAGVSKLAPALATAHRHHAYDLESVKALLAMQETSIPAGTALAPEHLKRWPETTVKPVAAEAYGWMAEVAAVGESL